MPDAGHKGIPMKRFFITVDVEEDLPGIIPRGQLGLEQGMRDLMRVFSGREIKADFFFLASVVRSHPDLVREVQSGGHRVGNHGLNHRLLCSQPARAQRAAIRESTRVIEEVSGDRPRMFRAPNFSVDQTTLEILEEADYRVDSSVLPGRALRRFGFLPIYDHRASTVTPHLIHGGSSDRTRQPMLELPVTPNPLRPGAPFGLGAVHYYGVTAMIDALDRVPTPDIVFLIHPWELVDLGRYYPSLPEGYVRSSANGAEKLGEFMDYVRTRFHLAGVLSYALEYRSP